MEEKKKGKGGMIALLVFLFLLCVGAGVYGYLNKDKEEDKVTDNSNVVEKNEVNNNETTDNKEEKTTETENKTSTETTVNNFDKVAVTDLNNKLSKLDFNNKTTSHSSEDEWLVLDAKIADGKVEIKINITEGEEEKIERVYTVEDINNAVSVGSGISVQGSGFADFYILTEDGKVYRIEDEISEVKKDVNYTGLPKNMLINNAVSIAVVDSSFNLADNAETTIPTVYIKTNDGRIFTNEPINEQQGLIEVIEK
ncbi:MAG: hypothetical protein IKR57_02550 [Bacilli bacterium]|nr:hypothetical protein [Bacilli bacterium]